jgi:hypothetical protein
MIRARMSIAVVVIEGCPNPNPTVDFITTMITNVIMRFIWNVLNYVEYAR